MIEAFGIIAVFSGLILAGWGGVILQGINRARVLGHVYPFKSFEEEYASRMRRGPPRAVVGFALLLIGVMIVGEPVQ
ncbi:hypothetical protein [Jannaschia donghaensis]|uniref:Uncharacterized protein n=1 Tax=Jannaschia donghaensis TaxID=420998 RepID=A0A0M6YL88_9RHOB|nr:hypothetical protein [Jannaschia donghaensis]CTQ49816.1 hypothetical protein JDO7802_01833 [Jannaschia donghaensis]